MYRDKSLLFAGCRSVCGIHPGDGAIFAIAGLQQFAKSACEQEQEVPFTGGFSGDACQIGNFSVNSSGLCITRQEHDAIVDWDRSWSATAGGIGKLIQGTGHGARFSEMPANLAVAEQSCRPAGGHYALLQPSRQSRSRKSVFGFRFSVFSFQFSVFSSQLGWGLALAVAVGCLSAKGAGLYHRGEVVSHESVRGGW